MDTIKYNLSSPFEEQSSEHENNWAMFAHLGTLLGCFIPFANIIIPIAIMQYFKNDSEFVVKHAKDSLNFQLTLLVYYIMSIILILILVGIIMIPMIYIASTVVTIIAGIKASKGEYYDYPFNMNFIK